MTSVPLSDVLSRQVALAWTEAVAVIAELCAVVVRDGGPDASIPDPLHILLTPDGAVTIRSDGPGASQGTTPGRLLHALLAPTEPPAPLRLFVSVAISSDRYDSVATFGEALGYYEAPGRGQLIQAAYRRAVAAPLAPADATPPPVPESTTTTSSDKVARSGVPTWAVAAGAAALVSASVAALWFSGLIPSSSGNAAPPGGDTAVAVAPAKEKAATTRGAAGRNSSSDTRQRSSASDSPRSSEANGAPLVRLTDKANFLLPNTGASPDDAGTPATASPAGAEPSGEAVYSSASSGVEPPVPISPLPATGLNPTVESTGTIELLVNEEGNVANVRLVSSPSRMQPMMLLSAAKTWKFRPAVRDGRPVKYRLRVNVPATLP